MNDPSKIDRMKIKILTLVIQLGCKSSCIVKSEINV